MKTTVCYWETKGPVSIKKQTAGHSGWYAEPPEGGSIGWSDSASDLANAIWDQLGGHIPVLVFVN